VGMLAELDDIAAENLARTAETALATATAG
jgi:hypothetical protein